MFRERIQIRPYLHYIFAWALLSYYGVEVCPYIESLGLREIAINFAFFYLPLIFVRAFFDVKFIAAKPLLSQPRYVFGLDLGLFLTAALLVTLYDTAMYQFPVGSGLKIVVGSLAIGYFAGFDSALARERDVIIRLKDNISLGERVKLFSLPKKIALLAMTGMVLISIILILLIAKDFHWLADNAHKVGIEFAKNSVIFEILFVFTVFLTYGIILVFSYARNLKTILDNETKILESVAQGNFEVQVPVVTDDEFGLIADRTNHMIVGLREREKIKSVFGKIVNPAAARRMLAEEADLNQHHKAAVLFSDIRNFTSMAEKYPPTLIVEELNKYFEAMVEIVHKNNGVVDKFIGDGMLAVFGLDDNQSPENNAVQAGMRMLDRLQEMQSNFKIPVQIGIGIHSGILISGIIGSSQRQEFTIIGDVVNTASRMESLTKEINKPMAISEDVYQRLAPNLKSQFDSVGEITVKGKSQAIPTYAISL